MGNTKHTVEYMLEHSHLFESIPTAFIKGAFLDRIHLYNPGWEVKMLKKDSFSTGYGLITDYIAAVLHELRGIDRSGELKKFVKFDASLSERDHLAIRKTFSGMMKLLYPDGVYTDVEALEIIDFAAECRKRVKDQLYIIDETFCAEPARFEYQVLQNGQQHSVRTLEELNNLNAEDEGREREDGLQRERIGIEKKVKREPAPELTSSVKSIRLNQKGVSYESLFGDYLKTARKIIVVDPFIRHPYQVANFMEFVQCARRCSEHAEELVIHLSTQNDEDKIPEMIDIFDDIKDDLSEHGIEFSYDFNADHDRYIDLDNGWIISLGRGLDIYDKVGRFSLDALCQTDRRCKEFNVAYNRKG